MEKPKRLKNGGNEDDIIPSPKTARAANALNLWNRGLVVICRYRQPVQPF